MLHGLYTFKLKPFNGICYILCSYRVFACFRHKVAQGDQQVPGDQEARGDRGLLGDQEARGDREVPGDQEARGDREVRQHQGPKGPLQNQHLPNQDRKQHLQLQGQVSKDKLNRLSIYGKNLFRTSKKVLPGSFVFLKILTFPLLSQCNVRP